MRPGRSATPKATIYAVAERAGVSIATVSRALRRPDEVTAAKREAVVRAVLELDYVPHGAARSLAANTHAAHGLVLPELEGPYWSEVLVGYEGMAGELGQSVVLVLAKGKRDIAAATRDLASRVDGLTVVGSGGLPTSVVSRLAERVPLVVLAGSPTPGADLVRSENTQAAAELTGRLLDSGRTALLFVGDPDAAVDVRERYDGFVAAHRERDRVATAPVRVPFEEAAGRAVADRVLRRRHRPDGLVCANDELALAALDRLLDRGVDVPGEVAVTGWDDIHAARWVRPRLTTVRQPVRSLAGLAARLLQTRIEAGGAAAATHSVPSVPVYRESCGTSPTPRKANASSHTRRRTP